MNSEARGPVGRLLLALLAILGLAAPCAAQSLDPRTATPLSAGENHGTLDSMVGPQYWSFRFGRGKAALHIHFTSMGLFGNPTASTMEVVLHAADGTSWGSHALTSNGHGADLALPATFKAPGSGYVELRPSGTTLVRSGGDYTIAWDGPGAAFESPSRASTQDPIVGTYSVMVCAPDFDCQNSLAIHFSPDGSVATTDGHRGRWSVFDPEARIYSVVMGADRWSLKLVPGRGLFNTSDLSVVVFQAVRPR